MKKKKGYFKSLLVCTLVLGLLFTTGCGKSKKEDKKNEKKKVELSDNVTFIEEDGDDLVFIDFNGNVIRLNSKDVGTRNQFSAEESYGSIKLEKDGKDRLVSTDGKVLFENEYMTLIKTTPDEDVYNFKKDGKYGVVNSKGKEIVPAQYSDDFDGFATETTGNYFYTINSKKLTIYNSEGKKSYEGDFDTDSDYDLSHSLSRLNNGMYFVLVRKDANTVVLVNLNTGAEVASFNLPTTAHISISAYGNLLYFESYEGPIAGDHTNEIKNYYMFSNDGKISRTFDDKAEKVSVYKGRDEDSFAMVEINGVKSAFDQYGNEIYKTTQSFAEIVSYRDTKNNKAVSYILDPNEKRNSGKKLINSEGKEIATGKNFSVGNKYILVDETTLIKPDGSKYMENVKWFYSIYDLDFIVTDDKYIIENSNGVIIEDKRVATASHSGYYGNYVFFEGTDFVTTIDVANKTFSEAKFNSPEFISAEKGYIEISTDSGYDYYNKNGEKIYTKKSE